MASWFDIKLRAILGDEPNDSKEVVILGRVVRWTNLGLEYEADPKHRKLVLEAFERRIYRALQVGLGRFQRGHVNLLLLCQSVAPSQQGDRGIS